ncbi:FKBP-type peptidyl-prolyl cis-trans isomerase [Limibacter armeniacum]|uniref:FKBP-type peptidyl-prolyl cis-trans isomerase n=1 Tax=Limibacter armeniacum TaxID=466084 RepID=UPI002FE540A9
MLTKKQIIIGLAAFGAISTGCDKSAEQKTTKSGYKYAHVLENEGDKAIDNDVVEYNLTIYNNTDSVLYTSDRETLFPPATLINPRDTASVFGQVFRETTVGDSVLVDVKTEDLFGPMVPPQFGKAGDPIKLGIKVLSMEPKEEYQRGIELRFEQQKDKEIAEIEKFLKDNNIEAQRTENGLFYVIHEEGKGTKPEAGQTVSVHYTGTLMTSGEKFDSSVDRGEPFEFPLGQGRVIKGWDEGIALLNKGAKATLYIPSDLAYGPREAGPKIKPFSILKFDVELLDIKKK